jgi:hypothetical protein
LAACLPISAAADSPAIAFHPTGESFLPLGLLAPLNIVQHVRSDLANLVNTLPAAMAGEHDKDLITVAVNEAVFVRFVNHFLSLHSL